MEWFLKTIKFRWWFLPFCWYLESLSPQQWCRKGRMVAHSCCLHPQEHQGPGCAQDWTPPSPEPCYPWAELAPWLHTPASAHALTLPFLTKICHIKHCDPSYTVPNMLLPGSSAQCILPALCLGFSPPRPDPAVLLLTPALGVSLTPWHASLHSKHSYL